MGTREQGHSDKPLGIYNKYNNYNLKKRGQKKVLTSNPKIKREDRRTLSVHKDTWADLNAIGERGETFDEIIRRLLSSYRSPR